MEKSEKCKVEKGPFNDNFTAAHQSKNNAQNCSLLAVQNKLLQTLPRMVKFFLHQESIRQLT